MNSPRTLDGRVPVAPRSPEVRYFTGTPQNAAGARQWAAQVASNRAPNLTDLVKLCVSELFTNAIRHSRSGQSGGTVAVLVASVCGATVVHVHDQGHPGVSIPQPRRQDSSSTTPAEGGHGLVLVRLTSAEFGSQPVRSCEFADETGPGVAAAGWCVWFSAGRYGARGQVRR
jgi:anti-sigma regulatory factor (Ser/Thr protein kinase)